MKGFGSTYAVPYLHNQEIASEGHWTSARSQSVSVSQKRDALGKVLDVCLCVDH